MKTSPFIRTIEPDEWFIYRAIRLQSLADAPDAFGSTFAEEEKRTDQDWKARLAAASTSGRDRPLIAELSGRPAGLVWAKVDGADPTVINLYQMWVAPASRRCGIAKSLLRSAADWARSLQARTLRLGVIGDDTPAERLYLREGFRFVGEPSPARIGSLLLTRDMALPLV